MGVGAGGSEGGGEMVPPVPIPVCSAPLDPGEAAVLSTMQEQPRHAPMFRHSTSATAVVLSFSFWRHRSTSCCCAAAAAAAAWWVCGGDSGWLLVHGEGGAQWMSPHGGGGGDHSQRVTHEDELEQPACKPHLLLLLLVQGGGRGGARVRDGAQSLIINARVMVLLGAGAGQAALSVLVVGQAPQQGCKAAGQGRDTVPSALAALRPHHCCSSCTAHLAQQPGVEGHIAVLPAGAGRAHAAVCLCVEGKWKGGLNTGELRWALEASTGGPASACA